MRLLNLMMEELDYKKLYEAYSPNGRNPTVPPKILFKILIYSYINDKLNKNFSIVENTVKGKSMLGFITRTSIKVLVHNISFFINKLIGNYDSIAKIKRLVFG